MLDKIKKENIILLFIGISFVVLNAIFLYFEIYYFLLIPFALIIIGFALLSIDKLFFIVVFFTPLSITLSYLTKGIDFNMYLPTEPLLLGIMFVVIIKVIVERKFDNKIIFHPISISILIYLAWLVLTTITSTLPVVSAKFFISKLWFIIPIFYLGTQIFSDRKKIKAFILTYSVALVIVIIYTTYRHITLGFFEQNAAHFVVKPFYNDHTAYGAITAFLLPVLIGIATKSKLKTFIKILLWSLVALVMLALILSYSRAAWLSVIAAFGVWVIIKLKIKLKYIIIGLLILSAIIFRFSFQIYDRLGDNKQDSSSELTEHVESISNVATDASNLERINRWNCAIRMFKEKPFFGWGPGTYMFQYAPFQLSYEKTIISTDLGERGNSHSEYLGPLSESGVLGLITFLILIVTSIYTSIKIYKKTDNIEIKMLSSGILLGLTTYYLHGFLNNFLDTDKLSVPFWGFLAILVALDIYHSNTKPTSK